MLVRVNRALLERVWAHYAPGSTRRSVVEDGLRALERLTPRSPLHWELQPDGVWLAQIAWLGDRKDRAVGGVFVAYIDDLYHGYAIMGEETKVILKRFDNRGGSPGALKGILEALAWSWWK